MKLIKEIITIFFLCCICVSISNAATTQNQRLQELEKLIGNNDSVIIADPDGKIIFSKNPDKKLIPASILKILTSLWAINCLGTDFRFKTEVYIDKSNNLFIKGFGDPLFISEVIQKLANNIYLTLLKKQQPIKNQQPIKKKQCQIKNIVLDATYFNAPITIPGTINNSNEPYDAPSGALCANFNTVFFLQNKNGKYVSAEPQTPLLPFIKKRIKQSKVSKGRIMLTQKESTVYPGYLIKHYLEKQGCNITGRILMGRVNPKNDTLLFTFFSPFSVNELLSRLLKYSNNFIANQLLITMGIKKYGPPGTLEKGVKALKAFAINKLGVNAIQIDDTQIDNIQIIEGSGISRENRLSAKMMLKILEKFKPKFTLLRKNNNEYYKTGTLNGIRTRAGYIVNKKKLFPYIIMINTREKSYNNILKKIKKIIQKHSFTYI